VSLSTLEFWVLSWVLCTSSGGSSSLILEAPILPSGVIHLHLSLFFLPLHFPYFHFNFLICSSFFYLVILLLPSFLCYFYYRTSSSSSYIVFFLCPLEVIIRTYLTTWLSLCTVRIFFRFLTIFCLKQNLINKV